MALTSVVRRSASRIAPLILRISTGGSHRCTHLHQSSPILTAVNHSSPNTFTRSFPSFIHHYSSKPSSDGALLRVIESEIKFAEDSQDGEEVEEVPKGFPFQIEDNPGQQAITLTRELEGETVTAEVFMPDLVTGEEQDDDGNDVEGEGRGNQSSIPLVVKVSKNGGPYLEFSCTAYPDEITIDSLTVKDPKNSEDQIAYEGPDFADLDENLQKAFHKYLEIRGIKPSVTNFLHGYMVDKDSREYIAWLKKLEKFVES
ncbi:uncharacterized protein At2g39795, mitochondrial-like [Andrographis paniculata]|uniref:uncharacterized protein At2g39795, mitochondrial-like n=1 Tax=Andrographis paniculata TaxID=175694 RepID=UPI0021E81C26|nr:uncharacterized protein At2g39795, mitochondrial-like [Andrographis paniculata]